MFTINSYKYKCPRKCNNLRHGEAIANAVKTSKSSDAKLAAFIAKTCKNFAHITDETLATALHWVAANGRHAIAQWLINYGADLNCKDHNGYTPLHRALICRNISIAVLLHQHGASIDCLDEGHFHPLNYCSYRTHDVILPTKEIYVWGSNKNYNLGIGNEEGRRIPQQLDWFSKNKINVEKVSISSYHCFFLDTNNNVYSVGHGKSGQLGIGREGTLVAPEMVQVPFRRKDDFVINISTARNHSLVLTSRNSVYSCGSNDDFQLGYASPKEVKFKEISFGLPLPLSKIKGILAKECHSIAYTDRNIFVWGKNNGQFGMKNTQTHVTAPQKIETYEHHLSLVDSSDSAIACYTTQNVIIIYFKFKTRTIRTPTLELMKGLTVSGGSGDADDLLGQYGQRVNVLKIIVRTESGAIYIWYEDLKCYIRCRLPQGYSINTYIHCWGTDFLYIANGDVFEGQSRFENLTNGSTHGLSDDYELMSRKDMLCTDSEIHVDVQRVPLINGALSVYGDEDSKSFMALQNHSKRFFQIPNVVTDDLNFKNLLIEASTTDNLHDIVFHVEDEVFPAHKFLIFSRAPLMRKFAGQKDVYLNYEHFSSKMFELMLKYIYSNHVLTMTDVEDIEVSLSPFSGLDNLEVYTTFREHAGTFGLSRFAGSIVHQGGSSSRPDIFTLSRQSYPELYDVTLICANERELKAHKCILVSRMEYFHSMFNHSWSETKTVNLKTTSFEYMEPIIDFLYTNDPTFFRNQNYSDKYLYNMVVICDQYFVNHLRNIVEVLIIDRITIKKCVEMLGFASDYNCKLLKSACLDFMGLNMARLLEHNALADIDMDLLMEISQHYKTNQPGSMGLSNNNDDPIMDVLLESFVEDFYVDLNCRLGEELEPRKVSKGKKLKIKSTSSSTCSQQERRNYEKEAMVATNKQSNDVEQNIKKVPQISVVLSEAETISAQLVAETVNWTKVIHKKELKKSQVLAGLKTNDILATEVKEKEKFTSLNKAAVVEDLKLDGKIKEEDNWPSTSKAAVSLANFTPLITKKISQKQRKNQAISSGVTTPPATSSPTSSPVTPNIPIVQNPWSPIAIGTSFEKTHSISQSPNRSFFQDMSLPASPFSGRSTKKSFSLDTSTETDDNTSFIKILKDEKRDREYYEKMKTKSLHLTQVEETAIAELKKFYNVENVHDENIVVGRAESLRPTKYMAVWHNN